MEDALEDVVELTPEILRALNAESRKAVTDGNSVVTTYWRWILELYAGDSVEKFGGLIMGEKGLLPIGLVSMLRSEKVRWQG